MPKRLLSLSILVFWAALFFAQTNDFEAANKAYQAQNYTKAIEGYEAIIKNANPADAALYYNLGNAYFKDKQLGKAILYYERALLLKPKDADVQFNLAHAKTFLKDDFGTVPEFFLRRWWQGAAARLSPNGWGIFSMIILWAATIGLLGWLFGKTRLQRKRGFMLGIGLIFLSCLFTLLGFSRIRSEYKNQYAIVLATETPLQAAPDERGTPLAQLHEGSKVKLLDKVGDYYKAQLSNGEEGWLLTKSVEAIRFAQ